jgi:hypothetical protein
MVCNRARLRSDPETLREAFGAKWLADVPNRWPIELTPRTRAPVIRRTEAGRVIDVMSLDVLGGGAGYPMTNGRNLMLPQWRSLAADPAVAAALRGGQDDGAGAGASYAGVLVPIHPRHRLPLGLRPQPKRVKAHARR